MTDETIRLILDMGQSGKTVDDVRARLERLGVATQKAADTYEVLSTVINKSVGGAGSYAIATNGVNVALDEQVRKAVEATHAQRAMAQVLDEMGSHTAIASAGVNQLTGNRSMGLMGASYAVQDFVTVVSMGGGWGRAMNSMANNVTPVLASLGVGMGLAGALGLVVTVASAGVSALEGWWKAADSEHAEAAKEKLREVEEQLKRTNAEFKKLATAATNPEKQAAEGFGLFFRQNHGAERTKAAIAGKMSDAEARAHLNAEQKGTYEGLEKAATASDHDIQQRAEIEAGLTLGADAPQAARDRLVSALAKQYSEERTRAQRQRGGILNAGRGAAANAVIANATVAGPEGAAARNRLLDLTKGMPGFKELTYFTPERIAADEAAAEADEEAGGPGTDAFADRARRGVRARKRRQAERLRLQRQQFDSLMHRRAERNRADEQRTEQLNREGRANAERMRRQNEADAAREAREGRPNRLAGEIYRGSGLALSPEAAAGLVGRGDHAGPEAMQQAHMARQIQQNLFQGTGQQISGDQALMAAKRMIDENNRAQAEAAAAMMGALSGMGQSTQIWRGMTQTIHRQMEQSPMPSGLPR